MEGLIYIAGLVSLASFIALSFMAMKSLSKLNIFLDEMSLTTKKAEKDLNELKEASIITLNNFNELRPKIEEALDDLKDLKSKSVESLQHSDDTMDSAKITLDKINGKIDKIDAIILPFEMLAKNFYSRVAEPVNTTGKVVTAVFKAANAFADRFKK
jgi:ABC-type transporter Mla subunit MlaD